MKAPRRLRGAVARHSVVACLAALAAVGALATHARPTAEPAGDVVFTIAFAVATTVLASRAAPAGWLAAWSAVLLLGGRPVLPPALVGTAVSAVALRWAPRRRDVLGGVLGAGLVQVLVRMPTGRLALNVVVAALALGALALGSDEIPAGARRALRVAVAVVVVLYLGVVVSVLLARRDLEAAVDRADAGLDAARRGDSTVAAEELDEAARLFRSAGGHLGSWWASPARYTPILGPNARSLGIVSQVGEDLASAASTAAVRADADSLRIDDGRLDLDQVAALAQPLADVSAALRDAARTVPSARSRWLVNPVASRLGDFEEAIGSALEDAGTAEEAVAVAPSLLGGDEPRTYFVVFGNPAETRELGGFMGAFATLHAKDGRVTLGGTARVGDINRLMSGRELADRSVFPAHYLAQVPQIFWQNVTGAADFPTVAEAVTQLWPSRSLGALDGVIYMDPIALGDLLAVTGPIRLDGLDRPLTVDTAADFLLRDQYAEFPDDDRHSFLTDAASTVFHELTSQEIDGPSALTDALAPAARARRIVLHSTRPDEEALFRRLGLDGSLEGRGSNDLLSVRSSNRGLNKVDAMLGRQVSCHVTIDPTSGTVRSTVEVTLSNRAPSAGLPASVLDNRLGNPPGTSSTTLAVYTPLDLIDVTQDGAASAHAPSTANGLHRYAVLVDIPPGGEVRLRFELEGQVAIDDGYRLRVIPQPLAEADRLDVDITTVEGWRVEGRTSVHRAHLRTEELEARVLSDG